MPITLSNGKVNLNQSIKTITDVAGRQIKGNIAFDGSNIRISAKENFIKSIQNRVPKGELSSLFGNNKKTNSYVFPSDIDDEHYLIINAIKRTKQTISEPKGEEKILSSFVLPIPGNLQVAYQAQYENSSLGILGSMAAGRLGSVTGARGVKDIVGKITNKITSMGDNDASQGIAETAAVATATGGVVAGAKVAGMLGAVIGAGGVDNVVAGTLLQEGIAFNPHLAVIFKGVDFRTHAFEYKFIARNQQDSDTLKKMLYAFQQHMLPANSLGSRQGSVGLAFDYPEEFKINFSPAIRSYLYKIGTCVLTQMTVNYNGEAIPTFFEQTGAPVSVTMNLSFQETSILTKDGFNDGMAEQPVDVGANVQTLKSNALRAGNFLERGIGGL